MRYSAKWVTQKWRGGNKWIKKGNNNDYGKAILRKENEKLTGYDDEVLEVMKKYMEENLYQKRRIRKGCSK